jgi:hypothetical protein
MEPLEEQTADLHKNPAADFYNSSRERKTAEALVKIRHAKDLENKEIYGDEKIDFDIFREEYKMSSSNLRMLIRELGLKIERVYDKQFVIGNNPFYISNYYYLKHAVFEYKATGYFTNTLKGEWYEYEVDIGANKRHFGVSNMKEEYIKPKEESYRKEPNKKTERVLVRRDLLENIGHELEGKTSSIKVIEKPVQQIKITENVESINTQIKDIEMLKLIIETLKPETKKDILYTQKKLLEVEQNGFLITSEQVGELLGMSKATISSKPAEFIKLGFIFTKVKEASSICWSVARYALNKPKQAERVVEAFIPIPNLENIMVKKDGKAVKA